VTTFSNKNHLVAFILILAHLLTSCTGARSFHDYARAGDTVAVAAGWAHHLKRANIQVTVTDSNGTVTTYAPGDPAIRASINLYPDPVSSLVLSDRLNQDITPASRTYAQLINQQSTGNDRDWWETTIFIDLPDPMALGDATITATDINTGSKETASSVVTIVPDNTGVGTGGTPASFMAKLGAFNFNLSDAHFLSMERVPHYVVSFSGITVPQAIQIDLSHNPDQAHGGTGTPYVVNAIGNIRNVNWSTVGGTGTNLRVIITPTRTGEITTFNDFKFYIAGGIGGLTAIDQDPVASGLNVLAFDANGNLLPDPVTATITAAN